MIDTNGTRNIRSAAVISVDIRWDMVYRTPQSQQ